MTILLEGLQRALSLILHANPELIGIVFLSLRVSIAALAVATIAGLPVGAVLGLKRFRGRGAAISIMNTMMGLPPVVVGLFLYLLLSRSGPLGLLGLLYTPLAMVIAQSILAFPIVVSLTSTAVIGVDPVIRQASQSLGASPVQASIAVVREARYGILSAIIAAFGRVMAEVGAILIVGGNIAGLTRVMTTAIALETDKGNFELALALGIVLLLISLAINLLLHVVQRRKPGHSELWA